MVDMGQIGSLAVEHVEESIVGVDQKDARG